MTECCHRDADLEPQDPAHPLVSVIMGTYNCEDTVEEAIDSIFKQTYTNWQLVVCDDGSTDRTYEVLKQIALLHPSRLKLLKNEQNLKLPETLNRCIAQSQGHLIARMDADDLSAPTRLAKQVSYLNAHPDILLVGTSMQRFGGIGEGSLVTPPPTPTRWSLRSRAPFCHATILARREVFEALDGYRATSRTIRVEDIDLWFRFFSHGFTGANLGEALYFVREDGAAIARRDFRTRWNLFIITIRGYRLLHYPVHWYPIPVLMLLKAGIPGPAIWALRQLQAKTHGRPSK